LPVACDTGSYNAHQTAGKRSHIIKITKTGSKVAKLGALALLPLAAAPQQAKAADNIAEIAMSAPQLTTLVTAVKAAGLDGSHTLWHGTDAVHCVSRSGSVVPQR
jgi:uncharacterized surface protein with fasciclin (FAS1) repeats